MSKEKISCPRCDSNKVAPNRVITVLFVVSILILIIPIAGWIISPVMLTIATILYFRPKRYVKCQECKNEFKVSKEKYIEFMKSSK